MSKEEVLASVFGTAPVTKDRVLSSVFGTAPVHKKAEPQVRHADASQKDPVYARLKKKALHTYGDRNHAVIRQLKADQPISFCRISKPLSLALEEGLRKNLIPFLRLGAPFCHIYLVTRSDKARLERCLENVVFRFLSCPKMYSYDEFEELCETNSEIPIYIKGLTNQEAESIRRALTSETRGLAYTMFRMTDGTWGFGVTTKKLVTTDTSSDAEMSLLESVLLSSLLLNGQEAAQYEEELEEDIKSDIAEALRYQEQLKEHEEIFIYDPSLPSRAGRITRDGYSRVALRKGAPVSLKITGSIPLTTAAGMYFLRHDLSQMKHRRMLFSQTDLTHKIDQWKAGQSRQRQQYERKILGKRILAKFIYNRYAERYGREDWFQSLTPGEIQMDTFRAEVKDVFTSLTERSYPAGYSPEAGQQLLAILNQSGLRKEPFEKISDAVEQANITRTVLPQRQYESIQEMLMDIKEHEMDQVPHPVRDTGELF